MKVTAKVAPRRSPPSPESLKQKLARFPWLYALSAIIGFASWIADSQFAADFAAQRYVLDVQQSRLSTNEILASQWYGLRTVERFRPEPDSLLLAQLAVGYIRYASNAVSLARSRLGTYPASDPDGIYNDAMGMLSRGRKDSVNVLADEFHGFELSSSVQLNREHKALYEGVVSNESLWSTRFQLLYVLSGVLVAAGFFRGWWSDRGTSRDSGSGR